MHYEGCSFSFKYDAHVSKANTCCFLENTHVFFVAFLATRAFGLVGWGGIVGRWLLRTGQLGLGQKAKPTHKPQVGSSLHTLEKPKIAHSLFSSGRCSISRCNKYHRERNCYRPGKFVGELFSATVTVTVTEKYPELIIFRYRYR
eukprot:1485516-Amphidinium_carterae.1